MKRGSEIIYIEFGILNSLAWNKSNPDIYETPPQSYFLLEVFHFDRKLLRAGDVHLNLLADFTVQQLQQNFNVIPLVEQIILEVLNT